MINKLAIIISILIVTSPIYSQSQKMAKLYTRYGVVIYGNIISIGEETVEYEQIFKDGKAEMWTVLKNTIYILIDENGLTLISNPELAEEYSEGAKRLVNKGIITEEKLDSLFITESELSKSSILKAPPIVRDYLKARVSNPDGEIGTAFFDIGTILPFDVPSGTERINNIFVAVGIPMSEQITISGGFQRSWSSNKDESLSNGSETFPAEGGSFSFQSFSMNIRFYIGR